MVGIVLYIIVMVFRFYCVLEWLGGFIIILVVGFIFKVFDLVDFG